MQLWCPTAAIALQRQVAFVVPPEQAPFVERVLKKVESEREAREKERPAEGSQVRPML